MIRPLPAPFIPITPAEAVQRALSYVGQGWYRLGAGAIYTEASPFDTDRNPFPGCCDCSGFTAWAAQYRRGNWNTDAMVRDARDQGKRFRLLGRDEKVIPGDFIVYPGPDKDGDGERDRPGHVGMITAVAPSFVRRGPEWWEQLQVAHCTPRKQATLGAIKLSDAALWANTGYIVRPTHYRVAS